MSLSVPYFHVPRSQEAWSAQIMEAIQLGRKALHMSFKKGAVTPAFSSICLAWGQVAF